MAEDNNPKDDFQNMSKEEFQSKLYVWFEEKGVLSELRTHLRHQMIEALKTTDLGHTIASIQNQNISPKYQALNLLIAEYFLQQRYDYSLSVFSSEVPMLSSLPKYTHKFVKIIEGTQNSKYRPIKFNDKDVWDILEALGLPIELDEAREIFTEYRSNSTTDTLLVWLIRSLTAALRKTSMGIASKSKMPHATTIKEDTEDDKANGMSSHLLADTAVKPAFHSSQKNISDPEKIHIDASTLNENGDSKIYAKEVDHIVLKLHERMQRAFDRELEIARQFEWQKCHSTIEQCDLERDTLLEKEREKLHQTEAVLREKLQQELSYEKQRLKLEEKINTIEMQRKIERKLEVERNLLKDEYRKIIQSKSDDTSGIIHNQENSLKLALQAVEYQSQRFKEQENMLSVILHELEKKSKRVINESAEDSSAKNVKDATCQTMIIEINTLNEEQSNMMERLKLLVDIQQKKIDQLLIRTTPPKTSEGIIIPKVESAHKEVQTLFVKVKSSQTGTGDDDFIKLILEHEKGNSVGANNETSTLKPKTVSSATNTDNHYNYYTIQHAVSAEKLQPTDCISNSLNSSNQRNRDEECLGKSDTASDVPRDLIEITHDSKSLSHILKNLRSENVYLKAFNSQQRLQIQELISNYTSMRKEMSNAHSEIESLSLQLVNSIKANQNNSSKHTEMKRVNSAPCSYRLKNESSPKENESSQHLSASKSHSSSKTIVERILERRKNLPDYHRRSLQSERTKKNTTLTTSDEENTTKDARRHPRYGSERKFTRPNGKSKVMTHKEDDSNPMDDVVEEARKTLKMLELESEAVDRSYREFKSRQSESLIEALRSKLRSHDRDHRYSNRESSVHMLKPPLPLSSEVLHRIRKHGNTCKRQTTESIRLIAPQTSTSDMIQQMPFDLRHRESPTLNVMRRVHEPIMKIDSHVLQNYINTSQKMSEYLTKNPKSFADSLLRNIDYKKRNANPSVTFNVRRPDSFNRYTMKISDWDNSITIPEIGSHSRSPVVKNNVTNKDQIEKEFESIQVSASNEQKTKTDVDIASLNYVNSVRRKLSFISRKHQNISCSSLERNPEKSSEVFQPSLTIDNIHTVNSKMVNFKSYVSDEIHSPQKTCKQDLPDVNPIDVIQPSKDEIGNGNMNSNNSCREKTINPDLGNGAVIKEFLPSQTFEVNDDRSSDRNAINDKTGELASFKATSDEDESHNSREQVSKKEDTIRTDAGNPIEDNFNKSNVEKNNQPKIDSVNEIVTNGHEPILVVNSCAKESAEDGLPQSDVFILEIYPKTDSTPPLHTVHETISSINNSNKEIIEMDSTHEIKVAPVNSDEHENYGKNIIEKSLAIDKIVNENLSVVDDEEENNYRIFLSDGTRHPESKMQKISEKNMALDDSPVKQIESVSHPQELDNLIRRRTGSDEELTEQQNNNLNKPTLSDVILSENNTVESSFELSDHSAISIPQVSDENESFWN